MYTIVGADQKEYGPVTEDQLRQWISDGRANGQTKARLNDGPWQLLAAFPEFAAALGLPGAPRPPAAFAQSTPPPLTMSPQVPAETAPTSNMAIAGLVCSIIGMFCCAPVFSTIGLVLSAVALSQITQYPSKYSGRGIAISGIIVAVVGYVLFAFLLSTGAVRRTFRHFRHF